MQKRLNDNQSRDQEDQVKSAVERSHDQTIRRHDILDRMSSGYVYCRVVYQDGHAVDLMHEEVNRAFMELTGFSDLIGRRITEVMPGIAESNPEFLERVFSVAESGRSDHFDFYLDGLGLWFSNSVFCPEKGYVIAIVDNISERKNAEEALLKSNEHFEAIIKAAGVGTWDWDIPSGKVILNQRWFDIVGYSREELEPVSIKTWLDLLHPEDLEEANRLLQKHFDDESDDYALECRMRHKHEEWVWVRINGKVMIRTPEGNPMRMLGTSTLINNRKLTEERLLRSERRFRTLFNSSSSIQALLSAETGKILDVNQAAADWYGWSIERMKQMYLQDICTISSCDVVESLASVGYGQQNIKVSRHRRVDGSIRDVEMFRTKIEIDGDSVIHVIIHDITQRKNEEMMLRESEKLFKSMFENHTAVKLIFDVDTGHITHANQAAASFYGWSREELLRMSIQEINVHPEETLSEINEDILPSEGFNRLFRHRLADGSFRDVEVFANKMQLNGQDVIYDIIHDVSDRIQAEHELTESEKRFRSMFEDHSAPMILIDPETGDLVDANHAAAEFYGWSIDQLKSMHISDINIKSRKSLESVMKVWQSKSQRIMSFRHRKADGSIRDVEIFGKMLMVNGKNLIYDIVHDVTWRKRLEQVNAFRLQLIHLSANHSVTDLLQKTLDKAEEITESTIGFFHFLDEEQKLLSQQAWSTNTIRNMCSAKGQGKQYSLDMAGVWADAARLLRPVIHNDYASMTDRKGMPEGHAEVKREMIVPILRENKCLAIIGVGNKTTNYNREDVKLIEMLANQVWDIVVNKIAVENSRQMQVQLEHAKKMEMVGQLAAGITHEINNPLNFLTLNNQILATHWADLNELVASYRQTIEQAEPFADLADQVHQIRDKEKELDIEMLLEDVPNILQDQKGGLERISAITASMKGYSYKNVFNEIVDSNLNKIVQDVVAIAKPETSFVAEIDLDLGSIPSVRCNSSQINQVLLNLILNSVHAIKSQNRSALGKIKIKTWSTVDHVFCSVRDDGHGVPDDLRDKVFSPFFTTKAPGEGTGLGLSISYDIIVQKHHGQITLTCPEDGGTVFTIALPLNN